MFRIVCRQLICVSEKGNLASYVPHATSARDISSQHQHCRQLSLSAHHPPNKVVFSGIQPTGVPHLGNYLGALREWTKLQNDAPEDTKLIFSIVDLHAITIPQNPGQLRKWKRQTLAALLAVGLNPTRSTIFHQSAVRMFLASCIAQYTEKHQVQAHTELMWILSCTASMGYLSRMTQWKSKLSLPNNASPFEHGTTSLKLGLFSYPVLQAADILVHRATHVPVGEDQKQHLEFTREIASSFNHIYGSILPLPTTILSPAKRVMSLRQPNAKMSKSHADTRSKILITDSPEDIRLKVKYAMTDSLPGVSYDPENRPGLSNLIEIIAHFEEDRRSCSDIAREYESLSIQDFKSKVADCLLANLSEIRNRYQRLLEKENGHYLDEIAIQGAEKAKANADATMTFIRDAVGL
ncbi:MAG: Tryptophan--tRNA ligase, mitochondrial [Trichoglossum hirsutum]|nr:MAG: Tryptophan--tRNA ligase, mitochondrial [Trichoglossum hirsutum]